MARTRAGTEAETYKRRMRRRRQWQRDPGALSKSLAKLKAHYESKRAGAGGLTHGCNPTHTNTSASLSLTG